MSILNNHLDPYLWLSDAVIITDLNHRIIDVNKSYERITGYSRDTIIGHKASIVKSPLTPNTTYQDMYLCLKNNKPFEGIFINKKRNGNLWHSSISITPMKIKEKFYYVGIFRDLEQISEDVYLAQQRKENLQNGILKIHAISSEFQDPGIIDHLNRVRTYTEMLLNLYNYYKPNSLSKDFIRYISNASILHDIGKAGVPKSILYKPGKLDARERKIVEKHPRLGICILKKSSSELDDVFLQEGLKIAHNIILSHHEKWDGTGYPEQLRGSHIPLEARII